MNRICPAILALLLGACAPRGTGAADLPAPRRTVEARSLAELQRALDAARPGDRISLADGVHRTDAPIRVTRGGAPGAPIVVQAARVGGAEIGGAAGFDLGDADHLVIRGFRFTHGATQTVPAGADHVRVTRNTFQLADSVAHWLVVSGDSAEVDHNNFQHKRTLGVYLAIEGPADRNARGTYVHHNLFLDHQFGGANGGESIRAGLSWRSLWSAHSRIEHNLFQQADGDPEAISVKSSDNLIRFNTIRDSKGCIVLRHGNRTTVAGNFVLDSGCGIRAYGNEHRIHDNLVSSSRGPALVVGSGTVRDHETGHTRAERTGYDAAERMDVAFNTLVGGGVGIAGERRLHPPRDNRIAFNLVQVEGGAAIDLPGDAPEGFRWEGNLIWGGEVAAAIPPAGYRRADPLLVTDAHGLPRPAPGSPAIDGARTAAAPGDDVDGQPRDDAPDVGADERSGRPITRRPLTRADVGPLAR